MPTQSEHEETDGLSPAPDEGAKDSGPVLEHSVAPETYDALVWFFLSGAAGIIGNRADALVKARIDAIRRATSRRKAAKPKPLEVAELERVLTDLAIGAVQARLRAQELGQDIDPSCLQVTRWKTSDLGLTIATVEGGGLKATVYISPQAPSNRQIMVKLHLGGESALIQY